MKLLGVIFLFSAICVNLVAAANYESPPTCHGLNTAFKLLAGTNCGLQTLCPALRATKPVRPPVTPPTDGNIIRPPVEIVTPKPPVSQPITKPITPPEVVIPGQCWAPVDWSGSGECALCPASAVKTGANGMACEAFRWTDCHPTKGACGSGGAGGGNCSGDVKCPASTEGFKNKRPNFVGPSCYTNVYGRNFGPNWRASGRTAFERVINSPTEFYRLIQTLPEPVPSLPKSWQIKGCEAAAAVYENFVCSLELIEGLNRKFEAPRGGGGASITEFANSGDALADKLEVAAFFSHKFKETARLTVWEENANGYAQPHPVYPPVPGQSYHGRGPVQISYNYNYGAFSEWFFGNKHALLNNPSMVDPEGPMGFIAALWFWFTPRDFTSGAPISGTLRTRDAIVHWTDGKINSIYQKPGVDYDAVAGLALSTNVINGGVECATSDGTWARWRVGYFLTVAGRMGIPIPDVNNKAACDADKFCRGLFSGCSSIASGAKCTAKDTDCGVAYISGWSNLCLAP